MKQLISVSVIAIFMAVSAFTFSTFSMMTSEAQASGQAWAKLDFGKDLYGLPNVADNREGMGYAMIGYGHDIYGLPNIADNRSDTWAKIGYGDALYGLPHISGNLEG
ncbi:hypothetical protein MNBD_NITROSPINAE01-1725 [hydrothermal vent metagenome]|uniref:Uncharacterized protein n=1 Tax=hydrothermal vent metagenome TaxID=652676 RepID=A0A3B1BUX7_9ZZZZ